MDNYIGDLDRTCKAKTRFAEAVSERLKVEEATRILYNRSVFNFQFGADTWEESIDIRRLSRKGRDGYGSIVFHHPRRVTSIRIMGEDLGVNLQRMMQDHFVSSGEDFHVQQD